MRRSGWLLFFFLLLSDTLRGFDIVQDYADPVPDSSYVDNGDFFDADAPADSSRVIARSFDRAVLKQLKADPDLHYTEEPTAAESLWDRFTAWISQLWRSLLDGAIDTDWGRVIVTLLGLVTVIAVIIMILRVNAFNIIRSDQGSSGIRHGTFEEDIHTMDFEKLIQEAIARNDYRAGVRLTFLYALKMLADKNLIHWNLGKTNHDYMDELTVQDLKTGFTDLNYYFEYAWYGNFKITPAMFSKVQGVFNNWKQKLR